MWRPRRQLGAMALGAVGVLVGTFLPWLRTGGRRRHSYDLFAVVERIGFARDGPAATALRWWPVVPLLVVSAVVAVFWGWLRVGGLIGVAGAFYAGATALAVRLAPAPIPVDTLAGTVVTIAAAGLLLGGSVWAVVTGVRGPVRWRRAARP